MGYKMRETRFDPNSLSPAAREGYAESGIKEYVTLGMTTTKHRSIETALTTAGSMRRIANAAGLTTPFIQMTTKEVKSLAVAIQNYVNPRAEEPNPRPYQVLLRSILEYHAGAADSKRDRVLIIALLEMGGRVSETLSLNVESLTRHQNGVNDGKPFYRAWFGQMKEEGTEHYGYIREQASVAIIDDWIANYPSAVDVTPRPLIPSLSFASNNERRLNADSVGDLLKAVAEKAGVEQTKHVRAHLFRHTRCSMLLREGVPEHVIRKFMGWKANSPMVARYAHLVNEDVEAALGLSTKSEGEKAELRVPKREVPAMPAAPFPLNPAMNAEVARLKEQVAFLFEQTRKNAVKLALQQESGEPDLED